MEISIQNDIITVNSVIINLKLVYIWDFKPVKLYWYPIIEYNLPLLYVC